MPRVLTPAKPKPKLSTKPKQTVTAEPRTLHAPKTVAELMKSLGNIPAHRIRLDVPPGRATEKDALRILDRENRVCEIVDGTLVEKPMGYEESRVAGQLLTFLNNFLTKNNLGIAAGPDGTLRLTTGLFRVPDISYISWDHLPGRKQPRKPVPLLALDLAVEVLSRSNSRAEMKRKVREYFDAGIRLVWLINPRKRSAHVYTSPAQFTVLTEADTLDGCDVLPGFRLVLRDLFNAASRGPDA